MMLYWSPELDKKHDDDSEFDMVVQNKSDNNGYSDPVKTIIVKDLCNTR